MTRSVFPFSTSSAFPKTEESDFAVAFQGEVIQTTLSSPEVSSKIHALWMTAVQNSGQQPAGAVSVQLRHFFKALLSMRSSGNGVSEATTVPRLAVIVEKACQSAVEVPPSPLLPIGSEPTDAADLPVGEQPVEEAPNELVQFHFDYSCLTSPVSIVDVTEMLCKIMASDAWNCTRPAVKVEEASVLAEGGGALGVAAPDASASEPSEEGKSSEVVAVPVPITTEELLNERLLNWVFV